MSVRNNTVHNMLNKGGSDSILCATHSARHRYSRMRPK
jgi:hypothetical protein